MAHLNKVQVGVGFKTKSSGRAKYKVNQKRKKSETVVTRRPRLVRVNVEDKSASVEIPPVGQQMQSFYAASHLLVQRDGSHLQPQLDIPTIQPSQNPSCAQHKYVEENPKIITEEIPLQALQFPGSYAASQREQSHFRPPLDVPMIPQQIHHNEPQTSLSLLHLPRESCGHHPFDYRPIFLHTAKTTYRNPSDIVHADWSCVLCGSAEPKDKFALIDHLIEHKKRNDNEGGRCELGAEDDVIGARVICPVCRKFYSKKWYASHVIRKHLSKDFYCEGCDVKFCNFYTLSVHNKSHLDGPGYECAACGLVCHTTSTLRRHIDETHRTQHRCVHCGKDFHTPQRLDEHKILHSPIDPPKQADQKFYLRCDPCNVSFPFKSNLDLHLSTIHPPVPPSYVCSICNKTFSTRDSLTSHSEVHDTSGRARCEICGTNLKRSFMERHLRVTHAGEKPHECITCGKRFTQRGSLSIHLRSHTIRKPYVCDGCGKGYVSCKRFKSHRQKCQSKDKDDEVE